MIMKPIIKTEGARDIYDVRIDTDAWLEEVAPIHERANEILERWLARRKARCERAHRPMWYSSDDRQRLACDYLVRVANRFERMINKTEDSPWLIIRGGATGNCENDLDDGFVWDWISKRDEPYYDDESIVALTKGEYFLYGNPEARQGGSTSFLDFTLGWLAEYLDGEPCETITNQCSVGYSSAPSHELSRLVVNRRSDPLVRLDRDGHFRAREIATGRTVKLYPWVNTSD
jgi:hypothetical protein